MTRSPGDGPPGTPGRRRHLTLLFADLSDSTRLGGTMEAEDYAALLAQWRALCRETVPRHGGLIARMQGDGMLALFGHPDAREDDGRRATEAALDLHAAVAASGWRGPDGVALTLHSGIHSGWVLVADGDIELGRFELMGDVPNLAARLCSQAGADDIVVSAETLGPQSHFFTTGERLELRLKGRTEPLVACRVLGRAPTSNRFEAMRRRGLSPFVGREGVLQQLRAGLRQATAGRPAGVLLCAGPGMGKTRLVEELLRHEAAARCRLLRGYCESYLSAEPLQPFMQMLRALPSQGDIDAASADALRQGLMGRPAAIVELFHRLGAEGPLLVAIDDWQWADQSSQQVLDALLALKRPLFVLLATRTLPDALPAETTPIELQPLAADESARIVRHLLPQADPFLVGEIHRYAGGMPLYLEELCHGAAAQGPRFLAGLGGLLSGGRAWLNSLIESRVARLPADQSALVRAAAVLGNVFPAWLLESTTGHAAGTPALRALAAGDFIFEGDEPGTLRFKHGLTRDAVVESVGLHERRALHRRAAEALQARADAAGGQPALDRALEALAYHCAAGGLPELAAEHAERAGDKAMAASALDRARAQYEAALKALDACAAGAADAAAQRAHQLRWCAVAQKLGMACVFDPLALADGLALFERGVALARASGDLRALARAEYWLGYLYYAKGLSRPAIAHNEAALNLAAQLNETRLVAQVRATLGQTLLAACRYDRALQLFDSALDSKRQQAGKEAPGKGSGVAVGSAYTLACKGCLLGDRGRFDEAQACFDEALALLGDLPHQVGASVRHWISVVAQWQGQWEAAIRHAEEAAAIAERVKSRQQLAMARALAGHARWQVGRDAQDLRALRDATAWIEARHGGLAMSLNHGWLVEAALDEGRLDEARHHAARLFVRARHLDRIGEALGCRALARAAARAGATDRALHYLQRAEAAAEARGAAHEQAANALCRAEIELTRGDAGEARRWLDAACAGFEAMRMWWHLQQAQRVGERWSIS